MSNISQCNKSTTGVENNKTEFPRTSEVPLVVPSEFYISEWTLLQRLGIRYPTFGKILRALGLKIPQKHRLASNVTFEVPGQERFHLSISEKSKNQCSDAYISISPQVLWFFQSWPFSGPDLDDRTSGANDLAHRQAALDVVTENAEPACSVQRLVLPDLEVFSKWFYGTEAMDHAGNEVYAIAKTLIPEFYALLQSKVEVVAQ